MALLSARLNVGRLNAERLNFIGVDTQAPTVPLNLTAVASPGRVDLAWSASTDNYGFVYYQLERAGTGGFAVIGTPTATTWPDTTVQPAHRYTYRVKAIDAMGNASAWSNYATVTTADGITIDIKVDGVWTSVQGHARVAGATITQALNEVADTASLRIGGTVPYGLKGKEIRIRDALGARMFAGTILATRAVYEGHARNLAYDCDCVDYTWLLNARKVSRRWLTATVSHIVADIVTTFGPVGYAFQFTSGTNPVLDEFTCTNEDVAQAISRACERAGLYWYCTADKVVWVFDSASIASAGTITQADPRGASHLAMHEDYAPVVTAVIARGGGASASIDVPPGSTTLPVDDPSWYVGGVYVESGPQRMGYAGVSNPGTGSIVGSGNAPTVGPTVTSAAGTNLVQGAIYKYAVSFVTASGESLPGGLSSYVCVGNSIPPPIAPTVTASYYDGSALDRYKWYQWALELLLVGGGRVGGNPSAPVQCAVGSTNRSQWYTISWSSAVTTVDPSVVGVRVCRTTGDGSTFYGDSSDLMGVGGGSHTSSNYLDTDVVHNQQMAGSGGALRAAVLANIPTSSASNVTARKLYRTTANGAQLQLLATLPDNTTTSYTDQVVDGALGAVPPAVDTSALNTQGQVPAGAPSIIVASTTPFAAGGGWVTVAGMTLHYTSVSGASIVLDAPLPSTVSYGTEVVNAPHLVGIAASGDNAIKYPILKGDEVYVVVVRWDDAAIAALAAATGGGGVRDEFITDGRLGRVELTARADAVLAMRKAPLVTVTFQTRDLAVSVGKTITIDTTSPPILGNFLIQRVQIADMQPRGAIVYTNPVRTVECSSRRYTFDDLVQQIKLLGRIN